MQIFHVHPIAPHFSYGAFTCAPCSAAVDGRCMPDLHCNATLPASIRAFSPINRNSHGNNIEHRYRDQLPIYLLRTLESTSSDNLHSTSERMAVPSASK